LANQIIPDPSAAGSKRVEVVLDAANVIDLDAVKAATGAKDNAAAVRVALFIAANHLPQP
jgi:hypothetical protein